MGISGLIPFLKNATRDVHIREFKGCTAAIDVYCFLHKGSFGCADKLAQGIPTDFYITYVMKYVNLLLAHNIKPILVFDGRNLPSKSETEKKRRQNRKENKEKAVQLLSEGKMAEAREYFQRCVDVTPAMAREVIQACRTRNVDCIVAPYEADAQLAFLNKTIADIVITEDSDLTLFGCDKIIFKLKDSGEGLLYEKRLLNQVFGNQADSFNFDKFRHMCILSGCDYLSSLSGIGLKKSQLFWSKVSNPNLKVVLPKLPVYLKKPTLTVSQDYINGFIQANNTFLYQLVYDPITRKERPLTEYGSGVDAAELDYCGQYSDPNTAYQLALGNVDLHTKQQMTWFDPDHVTSTSNSKYGSKAKHKSMWSKGFTKSSISPFSDNREIHKPREIVVRTNFKFKSPRKSIKSENCEIRGEKRKLETYTQLEVEQIIFSEDEDKEKMPLKKVKSSMCALSNEEREEELSPSKPYTRILGDNKLDIKNNLSSYFNGKEPTKQEVKELLLIKEKRSLTDPKNAGSWFDSLNKSSTLEGKFIYRTDDKDDKPDKEHGVLADISNSPPFSTPSIGAISPNSKPNLGAISPTSKPNLSALQAFQRDKSRNPFAVKKPIFKDSEKDPEGNPCPISEPIGREDAPGIDREDLQDNEETSLSEPMQQLLELSKRETEPSVLVRKSCFLTSSSARVGLSRPSGPVKAGLTRPSIFKQGTQTTVIPTGSGVRPSGLHKKGLKGVLPKPANQLTLFQMFAKASKKAEI